ncbi:LuxR family transcriptional regulator [Paenibacillaceae bacterium]|nr:LuxR family transcriptional regulator [Paenibacillaceae bacterium]
MTRQAERIRQKFLALADTDLSSQDCKTAIIEEVRLLIPFAAACCTAVDALTMLSTGAVTETGVENMHPKLFVFEYLNEDFNAFSRLAEADVTVAALSTATSGQLEQSARFRNVLHPEGFGDELRAALVEDGKCRGFLTLFRSHEQPFFSEEECVALSLITPALAYCLYRTTLVVPQLHHTKRPTGPGVLILSERLELLSADAAAESWLSALQHFERIGDATLPRPVRAVCMRALSSAGKEVHPGEQPNVCVAMQDGSYLSIRASRLHALTEGDAKLAVCFEDAKPSDMLPVMAELYGLSARETEILEQIVAGHSTREVAVTLHISAYTVQDHLKAIFAKTGFSSRRELIWHVYSRFSAKQFP